ncbi:MAG: rod shape-determining protein [bacterium]|nr:rod shape-determining protein [bacterium]
MLTRRVGIDLGTTETIVYSPRRGIVIHEPSVVALGLDDHRVLAVGQAAKDMLGRTPENIQASQPLREGVIADFRVTEAMLEMFLERVGGAAFRVFRPEVMVSVPAGITSTERRAVFEVATRAGARRVYLVKQPVAAAIGAGLPIAESSGHMIVHMGGGVTEAAVISLGGLVATASARVGGVRLDAAISEYVRKRYGLAIGERTAEEIKIAIGSAIPTEEEHSYEIRGRDVATGLPKEVTVTSNKITEAMQEELETITHTARQVLQETPPELSADVIDKGIVLTGGTALLRNMDKLIAKITMVPCTVADDPQRCVIQGIGMALENLPVYRRSLVVAR